MAKWKVDGKVPSGDVRGERIAAGTIGNDHYVASSVNSRALNNIITPFDPSLTYGGSWNVAATINAWDFLGYKAYTSTTGSNVTIPFNGTSISVIGPTYTEGGYINTYIDGALAYGAVNTFTILSANYYNTGGLSATATSIDLSDVTNFTTSGTILIDGEQISYTNKSGNTLTGCTRGVNGSTAAVHQAGSTVFAASTSINQYTANYQNRVTLWTKHDLSPGQHTLKLVLATDYDASSTGPAMYLNGFIVGGMAGAPNLNTVIRTTEVSVTTDANGVSNAGVTISSPGTSEQLLCVLGVQKKNDLTVKVGHMWKATTGELFITGAAGVTFTAVITTIWLGPAL